MCTSIRFRVARGIRRRIVCMCLRLLGRKSMRTSTRMSLCTSTRRRSRMSRLPAIV